ncbi:MAG: ABC1 kinase family protein, partial [Streptomycetales bacterium]
AEVVAAEVQQRTAEQLFKVLGELKGGAMKFGQALSIFEAALPEEIAGPYRATLTRLQDAAPPMPSTAVHAVLAKRLGEDWREAFLDFDDRRPAAASIGQVHRGTWADGRAVAVKVQYPGAGPALLADLGQVGRLSRIFGSLAPGLEIKPLVDELKARVAEELDYALEAEAQSAFAGAFAGDPDICVAPVVAHADGVLVTEWVEGTPLSEVIRQGSRADRDRAGQVFIRFLFSGPARAGMLHADPHPGNFRLLPDGRLGVLDFGAVSRLPDGLPRSVGRALRHALEDDAAAVLEVLRAEGFVKSSVALDQQDVLAYLHPLVEPAMVERFLFTRAWMREQATRVGDPRSPHSVVARKLNLPPSYLLIHRVTLGGIGVLCQLEAKAAFRAEMEAWLPGFAEPSTGAAPGTRAATGTGKSRGRSSGGNRRSAR